jgi:hypothetical protein
LGFGVGDGFGLPFGDGKGLGLGEGFGFGCGDALGACRLWLWCWMRKRLRSWAWRRNYRSQALRVVGILVLTSQTMLAAKWTLETFPSTLLHRISALDQAAVWEKQV